MSLGGSQKSQQEHSSPVKTPIILAKHEKPVAGGPGEPLRVSGRLWKPAEMDVRLANVPKHAIPTLLQSGELPSPQPAYKIQQRNDIKPAPGSDWTKATTQKSCLKIIDGYMNWCGESFMDWLLENNDYRVIGILGTEGAGKTHIMNLLASHPKKVHFPFSSEADDRADCVGYTTTGLNAYVTSERTILLDCQPLFSSSTLEYIIDNERKMGLEHVNKEDMCDAANLELSMFVLSVCHIVIVAENWFTDPSLHRILQTVEMLKPPQLPNEKTDDHNEFTSRIVFVQNMGPAEDADSYETGVMESSLSKIYSKSSLRLHRHAPSGNVRIIYLPLSSDSADSVSASICKKLEQRFVQDITSMRVSPILGHTALSEKNWFQYACKIWEAVRKYPFLTEYMRLLN